MQTGNCIDCKAGITFEPILFDGREVFRCRVCNACGERREQEAKAHLAAEARQVREAQWREICPGTYRATDPNHPAINPEVLSAVLSWRPGKIALGLGGPPGTGKTRMMFLLLKDLHFAGLSVCYVRATELARLASTMFDDEEKQETKARLRRIYAASVLFVDDLGKEKYTDRVSERFYDLIEDRGEERPTLWTSNHSGQKLESMMGERGDAICRRLREFSQVIAVTAPRRGAVNKPVTTPRRQAA